MEAAVVVRTCAASASVPTGTATSCSSEGGGSSAIEGCGLPVAVSTRAMASDGAAGASANGSARLASSVASVLPCASALGELSLRCTTVCKKLLRIASAQLSSGLAGAPAPWSSSPSCTAASERLAARSASSATLFGGEQTTVATSRTRAPAACINPLLAPVALGLYVMPPLKTHLETCEFGDISKAGLISAKLCCFCCDGGLCDGKPACCSSTRSF